MTRFETIDKYVGYVEILIDEGQKLSLDQAMEYVEGLYKEDTTRWKTDRADRFHGKKNIMNGVKNKLIKLGLK